MNTTRPPLPNLPDDVRPVIIWQLNADCPDYQAGKVQFKLEQVDGDSFYARDEPHMKRLLKYFGVDGVSAPQMERVRKRRLAKQRWDNRRIQRENQRK